MTSPRSRMDALHDLDLQPQPVNMAPLPTQRTSSPSVDTLLDPLLSLTPDKLRGPAVRAQSHDQHSNGHENRIQRPQNKKTDARWSKKGGEENRHSPGEGKSDTAISSHPEVLFQQQRTNQKALLEKNLKIIRNENKSRSSNAVKADDKSKENKVVTKFEKLTRPSKSSLAQTSAKNSKKSAILKSSGEQHSDGKDKKHVRIADHKHPLSSPEPHSTVVLGHQLTELKAQTFNPEEVVVKTLQESESARTALNERVAGAANLGKMEKKYSDLVSLYVPVDEVLQRTVTQRTSRVQRRPTKPTKSSEVPPPDILDMFSPSMIVESANLNATGLGPAKVKPTPVDQDMTFDLYRHMQCWDLGH